jgi:hypothetical protein
MSASVASSSLTVSPRVNWRLEADAAALFERVRGSFVSRPSGDTRRRGTALTLSAGLIVNEL